jgi:cold shock CspA family protein
MRYVGEVTFYNKISSYGFINELQEHGSSQFFHIDYVEGRMILQVGDIVSFAIEPSKTKPGKTHAVEIRLHKRDLPPAATATAGSAQ